MQQLQANDVSQARNDTFTVGVTTEIISYDNLRRKAYVLRNSSVGGQVITVAFGEIPAELNKGIVLSPGQAFSDADSENYTCWKGKINAISDVAGAILSVFER